MKKYLIVFFLIFMYIFSLYANDYLIGEWIVVLSFDNKEDIEVGAEIFHNSEEYRIIINKNEFNCFIDEDLFFIGNSGYYITIENDNAFAIIPAYNANFIAAKFRRNKK